MSKMSQLHMELSEQAYELGFEDLGEAEQAGYGVDWEKHKLIPPEEAAHKAWTHERDVIVNKLEMLINDTPYEVYKDTLRETVEFIKGCHE